MASRASPPGAAGADDDNPGDDADDVLGGRLIPLPSYVPCRTLAAHTAFSSKKVDDKAAAATNVNTFWLIAATMTPFDLGATILKQYKAKDSPFATKTSRKVLHGTLAKATFGSKAARVFGMTKEGVRKPGGRIPGWEALAHLYAACPYIIRWRFEHEPWADIIDRRSRPWEIESPSLSGDEWLIDPVAPDGSDDDGGGTDNPAENASYTVVAPTDADGSPPGLSPARRARQADPTATAPLNIAPATVPLRHSPRRILASAVAGTSADDTLADAVARVVPAPRSAVLGCKNGRWFFVCDESQIQAHINALTTRMVSTEQKIPEREVKLTAEQREDIGDALRMLLRPPPGGRHFDDDTTIISDEYVVECRPNSCSYSKVAQIARTPPTTGATAQPSPGSSHASWTWKSMVRLIELWTIQHGQPLAYWTADASHGIPAGELTKVAESWDFILAGTTNRADLDSGALKHGSKWAAITEAFGNAVSARARSVRAVRAHRCTQSLTSPPRTFIPLFARHDTLAGVRDPHPREVRRPFRLRRGQL